MAQTTKATKAAPAEEGPRETTWASKAEEATAKATRVVRAVVEAIRKGEAALDGRYDNMAEAVMNLRSTFHRTLVIEGKAVEVRDWNGRSRPYQSAIGSVYDGVFGTDVRLRTVVTDRVRYHVQTLQENMVSDGRIPRAEALALGLTKSKRTRAAEAAQEKREEAKAIREEAKAIVESSEGKAEASMAETLKFGTRVLDAVKAAPDLQTLGVTPQQMRAWVTGLMGLTRSIVSEYDAHGWGDVFPKAEEAKAVEAKAPTKATRSTRKATAA